MASRKLHRESHLVQRVGWIRAAVLGANDGIISTASLVIGVASGGAASSTVLLTGLAGLVAGAMSMAAGEYVSVSSQADLEQADLRRERRELRNDAEAETRELASIYEARGLESQLAKEVARQLMAKDALGAHARDELGLTDTSQAKPLQAALASALSFAAGAALPVVTTALLPGSATALGTAVASIVGLGLLGTLSARLSRANVLRGTLRVVFWGSLAMLATSACGTIFKVNL